jgi:hypothetical protein
MFVEHSRDNLRAEPHCSSNYAQLAQEQAQASVRFDVVMLTL